MPKIEVVDSNHAHPHFRLTLPKAWQTLINASTVNAKDGKLRTAIEDPQPYYDDARVIPFALPDTDATITVFLCSGQENYWASLELAEKGDPFHESAPLHDWSDYEYNDPGSPEECTISFTFE